MAWWFLGKELWDGGGKLGFERKGRGIPSYKICAGP